MSLYRLKDDPEELYNAYLEIEPELMIITPKIDESKQIQELKLLIKYGLVW